MSDSFDLRRFVDAQAAVYRQVVEELSHGRKQTHWDVVHLSSDCRPRLQRHGATLRDRLARPRRRISGT
jgi:uncharacterized protein (DUF1810 family)